MLSIVIPAYNTENYLERCLESILQSDYSDVEVILINDGSTDRTGLICDNYAKTYPCVKAFHTRNLGVSSARNIGIIRILESV